MESGSSLAMFLLVMCSINTSCPFSYSATRGLEMASESFRTGVRMPETSGIGVAGLAEEEEQKQKWYLQIRRLYNGHILCVGSLLTIVFMRKDKAHEVLKVHKRANYFLEEIRPGNLERECNEEKCSFEEAKEIFHSQEKTMEFWFNYKGLNPCSTNPCNNGGVCKIRHYNYFCICPPKFGGDNCEKEKLECWYKNGGCWQYCRDSSSAFHVACSCAEGYSLHEDGKKCVQAAPFPCGLIKARQALEEERPGQQRPPRGRRERGADVAQRDASTAGTVRPTELEQSTAGENETLKDTSGWSRRMEGNAGQTGMAEDASSGNKTLVGSATQQQLGDGAVGQGAGVPELGEAAEGPTRPGASQRGPAAWSEPTPGAVGQDESAAPAASQEETVGPAAGDGTGASQAARDGLPQSRDGGNVSGAQASVAASSAHSDSRVTGGTLCQRGHCPWQVLIRNGDDVGFCGGSLISSRWVVTAAHCLDLVRPHHVTVGDFDKYQREFKEQKIAVERSWTHPHYDSNDYNGDIALLYLSSDVVFNEYAVPICLPSPNLATLLLEEGRIGTVSGWGATHARGPTLRFLMKVRLPIVNLQTCQRSMDRLITDNMFCAGHHAQATDACKGDSGGPFVVSYHNTWFLLGIVSWGEGCAERGKYGVYTRVSNYIPWIKETVESVADSENFSITFS